MPAIPSSEELKANMRAIITREGEHGLRAARARVVKVHAAPDTREPLRAELARWLQCAREVLGDEHGQHVGWRPSVRVYLDGGTCALGGAHLRRRLRSLSRLARKPRPE